jgi:hypothetical protein
MAAKKEAIKVGSLAPDFTLKDHNGEEFSYRQQKESGCYCPFTHWPGPEYVPTRCGRWKRIWRPLTLSILCR